MRKKLAGFVALLCATSLHASAAGVNLRWDVCLGDGGSANRAFACNNNSTPHPLVGAFALPAPVGGVTRVTAVIQITSASATLPAWWEVRGTTACRSGAVSGLRPEDVFLGSCEDWTLPHTLGAGASAGVVAYVVGDRGPNTARLEVAAIRNQAINLLPGHDYVGAIASFNSVRTVGAPSCAGCDVGVCLALSRVEIASGPAAPPIVLTTPSGGPDANVVTWQGGGNVFIPGGADCAAATAVRRSAWGQLKSMYR